MKLLAESCENMSCPSISQSNDGKIIVRGRLVASIKPGDSYPDHPSPQYEADVEIPRELLEEAIRKLSQEPQEADETSKANP